MEWIDIFFVIFQLFAIPILGVAFLIGQETGSITFVYHTVIQRITKKLQKKWQKTIVDMGKKPIFAPQFTAEERWVSG